MIPDAKPRLSERVRDVLSGPRNYRIDGHNVYGGARAFGSIEYSPGKSQAVAWATEDWLKYGGRWTVTAVYPSGREKVVFDTNRYTVH